MSQNRAKTSQERGSALTSQFWISLFYQGGYEGQGGQAGFGGESGQESQGDQGGETGMVVTGEG